MFPTVTLFLWVLILPSSAPTEGIGYLYQPAVEVSGGLRGPSEPYHPQLGELFLSTAPLRIAVIGHQLAGGRGVQHSGLMVFRPAGSPATLDAAPNHIRRVTVLAL